jgi:hypothetical protein
MPRMTVDDVARMAELRTQGLTHRMIREHVPWGESTISLVMRRLAQGDTPEQITDRSRWGGTRQSVAAADAPLLPTLPDAICADADPEIWFRPELEPLAVTICQQCPVLDACRRWALRAGIRHGVWGGMTENVLRSHTSAQRATA